MKKILIISIITFILNFFWEISLTNPGYTKPAPKRPAF